MTAKQDTRTSSTITRRTALSMLPTIGALPVGAAIGHALSGTACAAELPGDVDPLIDLWREREAARISADAISRRMDIEGAWRVLERERQPFWNEQWFVERRIAQTAPISPEGAAIVATVQLAWYAETALHPDDTEIEAVAGATLARHILANTPADVLRRAGLGVRT